MGNGVTLLKTKAVVITSDDDVIKLSPTLQNKEILIMQGAIGINVIRLLQQSRTRNLDFKIIVNDSRRLDTRVRFLTDKTLELKTR